MNGERSAEGRSEVILELGAEGGRITLYGRRNPGGWLYSTKTIDQSLLLFDEGPEIRKESEVVDSWEAALGLINRYPWHRLNPRVVLPEFREKIWAAVQSRFASDQRRVEDRHLKLERWREVCARPKA